MKPRPRRSRTVSVKWDEQSVSEAEGPCPPRPSSERGRCLVTRAVLMPLSLLTWFALAGMPSFP